jgi:hypothetical protein
MGNNVDESAENAGEEAKGGNGSAIRDAEMRKKIPQLAAFLAEGWKSDIYQHGLANDEARENFQLYVWYLCRRKAKSMVNSRGGETVTMLSNQYFLDITEKMQEKGQSARITHISGSTDSQKGFLARIGKLVKDGALDEYRNALGSRRKEYKEAVKKENAGVLVTADDDAAHAYSQQETHISAEDVLLSAELKDHLRTELTNYLTKRSLKDDIRHLVMYLFLDDGDTRADAAEDNEHLMQALNLTRATFFRKKKAAGELLNDFYKSYHHQFC